MKVRPSVKKICDKCKVVRRKGVVRIDASGSAELFLSGPNIVGLAFSPSKAMVVATSNSLYRVDVGIKGFQFS